MPFDAETLAPTFLLAFIVLSLTLRIIGSGTIPLVLNWVIVIPLASLISISRALDSSPYLNYFIYASVGYFVVCSLLLRFYRNKKIKIHQFNEIILYGFNIILSIFFIPIFYRNLIESENFLSSRIEAIQGLGFIFYPHYFLSIGVISLILIKLINQEKITPILIVTAFLSSISVVFFGSRFFPILIICVIFLSVDINKSRISKIFIGFIFISGLTYFYLVSSLDNNLFEKIGFRVFNSADIIYYLGNAKSLDDISSIYPLNFLDLILNPFAKLLNPSHAFSTPGPYLFNGGGQGALPLFLFDSIFYFGNFYLIYLLLFPIYFWVSISIATKLKKINDDGSRIFIYCLFFLPALYLMSDISTFNGFFYGLFTIFLISNYLRK
jgi:hypothetical protein